MFYYKRSSFIENDLVSSVAPMGRARHLTATAGAEAPPEATFELDGSMVIKYAKQWLRIESFLSCRALLTPPSTVHMNAALFSD